MRIKQFKDVDVCLFTGGADLSPSLYGEPPHPMTNSDSDRDRFEVTAFRMARAKKIPMIGICRGAQLFCIMHGGRLIQHANHPHNHHMELNNGEKIGVNSLHHQLMDPGEENDDYEMLGWANNLSPRLENGYGEDLKKTNDWYLLEPEAIYWPNTRCFGVQYHPEMLSPQHPGVKFFQNTIDTLGLLQ